MSRCILMILTMLKLATVLHKLTENILQDEPYKINKSLNSAKKIEGALQTHSLRLSSP